MERKKKGGGEGGGEVAADGAHVHIMMLPLLDRKP
jgi:hypothetical protein